MRIIQWLTWLHLVVEAGRPRQFRFQTGDGETAGVLVQQHPLNQQY